LGRKGIALRGHDDSESNFMQLLNLQACDDPKIVTWLQKNPTNTQTQIYRMDYYKSWV